jgi:hypothetical protein
VQTQRKRYRGYTKLISEFSCGLEGWEKCGLRVGHSERAGKEKNVEI